MRPTIECFSEIKSQTADIGTFAANHPEMYFRESDPGNFEFFYVDFSCRYLRVRTRTGEFVKSSCIFLQGREHGRELADFSHQAFGSCCYLFFRKMICGKGFIDLR